MRVLAKFFLSSVLAVFAVVAYGGIEDLKPPYPLPKTYEGNFVYFEDIPNTLFLLGEVEANTALKFRRALRDHDISKLVLLSEGGDVDTGLSIALIARDKGLKTYIPKLPEVREVLKEVLPETLGCMSACSFIYFGGESRFSNGAIGIHQISSVIDDDRAEVSVPLKEAVEHVEQRSQNSVAEIISTLNSLDVSPEIYEYMFETRRMYFLNDRQVDLVSNGSSESWHNKADTRVQEYYRFAQLVMEIFADENDIDLASPSKPTPQSPTKGRPSAVDPVSADPTVVQIQTLLNRHQCNAGPVDGFIGDKTRDAFARFAEALALTEQQLRSFEAPQFIELMERTEFPACGQKYSYLEQLPKHYGPSTYDNERSLVGRWEITEECKSGSSNRGTAVLSAPGYEYFAGLGDRAVVYDFYLEVKGLVISGKFYEIAGGSQIRIRFENAPTEMQEMAKRYTGIVRSNRVYFSLREGNCTLIGNRVPESSRTPKVQTNVDKNIVREIQTTLNEKGCVAGVPDGVMGASTGRAMRRFLSAATLPLNMFDARSASEILQTIQRYSYVSCEQKTETTYQKRDSIVNASSLVGDWAVLEKCTIGTNIRIVRGQATVMNKEPQIRPDPKFDTVGYEVFFVNEFKDKFNGRLTESRRTIVANLDPLPSNKVKEKLSYTLSISADRDTLSSNNQTCTMNAYRIKK